MAGMVKVGWGREREMLVNYTRQVSSRDSTSELRDGGFLEAARAHYIYLSYLLHPPHLTHTRSDTHPTDKTSTSSQRVVEDATARCFRQP